jgi:hypothetical protein
MKAKLVKESIGTSQPSNSKLGNPINKGVGVSKGTLNISEGTVWNDRKVQEFLKDFEGMEQFGENEAFDIADSILMDEPGLVAYLATKGITDATGWLANKL